MTTQAGGMRAGYQWQDPERVRQYIDQNDRQRAELPEIFALLVTLLPFDRAAAIRVLDIGSGHGTLAGVVLQALPNAQAVGLDLSDAMMEVGKQRMAHFGDRFQYHVGDFSDGALPAICRAPSTSPFPPGRSTTSRRRRSSGSTPRLTSA